MVWEHLSPEDRRLFYLESQREALRLAREIPENTARAEIVFGRLVVQVLSYRSLMTDRVIRIPEVSKRLRESPYRYGPCSAHARMSDGDLVCAFEEIAAKPNAFAYPIEYIKPKR